VMNTVGNRNYVQQMKNCSMQPIEPVFLLLGRLFGMEGVGEGSGVGCWIFVYQTCSQQVLAAFPTCSQ
jgi:hypothetical protein